MTVAQALAEVREFNHKEAARVIEKELARLREFDAGAHDEGKNS